MRNLVRALLAGCLGLVLLFVAGCGASGAGLLTGNQASALQNQLQRISSALTSGDCTTVQSATRGLAGAVAGLPSSINDNLRQALVQEASQVSALSVQQCHPASSASPTTTTTSTTPATTSTSTTQSTTTPPTHTNTTTTSTTTSTPATTPTTPGNNGGSSGGGGLSGSSGGAGGTSGSGNGNGNGNG